jgi:hypothetical protein
MPDIHLRGHPVPWLITGAVLLAAPLLYVARLLKARHDLKHLPLHVLRGPDGMEAHISPLGAVIQRLYVPDAQGNLEDVVLGFDSMEPYAVLLCAAG